MEGHIKRLLAGECSPGKIDDWNCSCEITQRAGIIFEAELDIVICPTKVQRNGHFPLRTSPEEDDLLQRDGEVGIAVARQMLKIPLRRFRNLPLIVYPQRRTLRRAIKGYGRRIRRNRDHRCGKSMIAAFPKPELFFYLAAATSAVTVTVARTSTEPGSIGVLERATSKRSA